MHLSGRKRSSLPRPWTQRQRVALLTLISINVAVFVVQLFLEASQPELVREYLGLSDAGIQNAYAWQFFTAIFLHNGPWHLVGNMLLLYLLGRDVESIIGQQRFLFLYFSGAIAGELGHLFFMPASTVSLAGSGGVAAVLVAYATILPELELSSTIRLKAKHLAYGVAALSSLLVIIDRTGTVIHSACVGGCAAGWLYAHLLGFGRPSFVQRALKQRRANVERLQLMSPEQFITEQIDPLLDKIFQKGIDSLTRSERRTLARAREKLTGKTRTP